MMTVIGLVGYWANAEPYQAAAANKATPLRRLSFFMTCFIFTLLGLVLIKCCYPNIFL